MPFLDSYDSIFLSILLVFLTFNILMKIPHSFPQTSMISQIHNLWWQLQGILTSQKWFRDHQCKGLTACFSRLGSSYFSILLSPTHSFLCILSTLNGIQFSEPDSLFSCVLLPKHSFLLSLLANRIAYFKSEL